MEKKKFSAKSIITIIGVMGLTNEFFGGQPEKTRQIVNELNKSNRFQVEFINMYRWQRNPFKILFQIINKTLLSKSIIIIPAQRGLIFFSLLSLFFSKRICKKIHYIVIGAWFINKFKENIFIKLFLNRISSIYVETTNNFKFLTNKVSSQVLVMKNFKDLSPISSIENRDPNKYVYFSRITELKGILDLIEVFTFFSNSKSYSSKLVLHIYGVVDESIKDKFFNSIKGSNIVKYMGVVNPNDSVNVLSVYSWHIFPTKYFTEGIPGSIIDSFFAGVPLISSKWENYDDVLKDSYTSIGYKFNDKEALLQALYTSLNTNRSVLSQNCISESIKYSPKYAINPLIQNLNNHQ